MISKVRVSRTQREQGATAIEFALIFPLFLMILLAIVAWSTMFFVQGAMSSAAQESVRTAMTVDPEPYRGDPDGYREAINEVVTEQVVEALSIIPSNWADSIQEAWGDDGPVSMNGDYVVVELRYPEGTPVSGVADLGLFQGVGLVPEDGVTSSARMPLRTVPEAN